MKSSALQGSDGFESAENANGSVETSRVGDRVDVRAGANGGKLGLRSLPSRKGVAGRVFADGETSLAAKLLDELAATAVGFGEDDSGRDRRQDFGDISKRVEFSRQSDLINFKVQAGGGSNPYREDTSRGFCRGPQTTAGSMGPSR